MTERTVTWLTTSQIADHLKVHPNTIRRYIDQGMPAHRLTPAGRWRFDPVEVDGWLRSQTADGQAA